MTKDEYWELFITLPKDIVKWYYSGFTNLDIIYYVINNLEWDYD